VCSAKELVRASEGAHKSSFCRADVLPIPDAGNLGHTPKVCVFSRPPDASWEAQEAPKAPNSADRQTRI
jgi:hypothetical protein